MTNHTKASGVPEVATARPWMMLGALIWSPAGKAVICAISQPRASQFAKYQELNIGSDDFKEVCANQALIIEAVNAYDTLREENAALRREIEFAVKNGSRWTLNDWRNWRASHATAALAGKQES